MEAVGWLILLMCFWPVFAVLWEGIKTAYKKSRAQLATLKEGAASPKQQPGPPLLPEIEMAAFNPSVEAGKLINLMLEAAVTQHAEKLKIEPYASRVSIRMILDGELKEWLGITDKQVRRLFVAGLLARAGIGTSTGEESGAFRILNKVPKPFWQGWNPQREEFTFIEYARLGRLVHVAVSRRGTAFGTALDLELRRESPSARQGAFDLGFEPEAEQRYIEALLAGTGVILFNGPCNVGKSTASYAGLELLVAAGKRVATLEWPIHHRLRGASQNEFSFKYVDEETDKKALAQLCAVIEEKPEVLLVQSLDYWYTFGPDFQRAAVAFAEAGGLVLSAMHFSYPYGMWNAIDDANYEPGNNPLHGLNSLLTMVISPRLLPLVCADCAEERSMPAMALRRLGLDIPPTDRVPVYRGRGCPRCNGSGYYDKAGVYEVLPVTPAVRSLLSRNRRWHPEDPLEAAWSEGMLTLRECALLKVVRGDTTPEKAADITYLPDFLARARGGKLRIGENFVHSLSA